MTAARRRRHGPAAADGLRRRVGGRHGGAPQAGVPVDVGTQTCKSTLHVHVVARSEHTAS